LAASDRIDELRARYEENPRRFFALLANEYRKAGDLPRAIGLCRTHLPETPGNLSAHIVLGQALGDVGDVKGARDSFLTAVALDPENLIALRHLADLAEVAGDRTDALRWYGRVLEVDPRDDEVVARIEALRPPAPAAAPPAVSPPAPPPAPVRSYEAIMEPEPELDSLDLAPPPPPPVPLAPIPEAAATLRPFAAPDEPMAEPDAFAFSAPTPPTEPDAEPAAPAAADGLLDDEDPFAFDAVFGGDWAASTPSEAPASEPMVLPPLPDVERLEVQPADAGWAAPEPVEPAPIAPLLVDPLPPLPEPVPADVAPEPLGPARLEREAVELDAWAEALPVEDAAPVDAAERVEDAAGVDEAEALADLDADASPDPAPFATETMAELYLAQGLRQEAIAVYRRLVAQRPGDAQLEAKLEAAMSPPAPADVPTARGYFAALASRLPATSAAPVPPLPATGEASPALPVAPATPNAPPLRVLAPLFGAAAVPPADERIATLFAAAYGDAPPPRGPVGRPTHEAGDAFRLDLLFRPLTPEPVPATPAPSGPRASDALRFDQYFQGPAAAAGPEAADPAPTPDPATGPAPDATDGAFQAWLNRSGKPS
jgi:tetratricopeptide (TPR) repeat protein